MFGLFSCPVPKQVAAVDDMGEKTELWADLFNVTALLL